MKKTFAILIVFAMLFAAAQSAFAVELPVIPIGDESESVWQYDIRDGKAVVTAYKGRRTVISLPATLADIPVAAVGSGTFEGNAKIVSITLPEGLTLIEQGAFASCGALSVVKLPSTLETIGNHAFYDCDALKSVKIPASLVSADGAFDGCDNLASATITAGMTKVPEGLFSGSGLKRIALPEGVTEIGERAFSGCVNLASVTLPSTLTAIGEGAFGGCAALSSVDIPASLASANGAFDGCEGLVGAAIADGMETIPAGLFKNAPIVNVTIPASVTLVKENAFAGCEALETVLFTGNRTQWDSILDTRESGNDALASATLIFPCETHNYEATVTAPTCEEGGYTTYTCSKCGTSYVDDRTEALGHDWGEWTVTSAPTCAAGGVETRVCSRDSSHVETRGVDPTGAHEYSAGFCVVCGAADPDFTAGKTAQIDVASASAAAGDRIELTVSLTENPGIAAMWLTVLYDSDVLTLVDVEDGGLFGAFTKAVNLVFDEGFDVTETGTLMTLKFEVAANAPTCDTQVSIQVIEASDYELEDVAVRVVPGTVSIEGAEPVGVAGDVTGDGKVNSRDVIAVMKAVLAGATAADMPAADLNGDEKINSRDVIAVMKLVLVQG